ncbi:MAG: flagellar biosynthesis protein FliQ [Candidatus Eisenbacteria bacterium]|nr:flagellar biosynthesis protein FliQ [Candidatus Eisenbacteria bacterium]
MSEQMLIGLGREALWTALQVAGPMLFCGLVAGLAMSVLQAVTQIQEASLSFIPKILGVSVALLIFMPWMIQKLMRFTTTLFGDFQSFIR